MPGPSPQCRSKRSPAFEEPYLFRPSPSAPFSASPPTTKEPVVVSMAAIAIPFASRAEEAFSSCSPLSRPPFIQLPLSPSQAFPITAPPTPSFASIEQYDFELKPVPAPYLPPTPPSHDLVVERFVPTKANRPTPIVPAAAPLPEVHSGSIVENFRVALKEIDMDECEAHGENAFFVCDLAEVWRQHMRWTKELGYRVEAFFGTLSAPACAGLTFELTKPPRVPQPSSATPIPTSSTFSPPWD